MTIRLFCFQDGREFTNEQTLGERRRVRILLEALHWLGLYDWKSWNGSQSHSQHSSRFQRSSARGSWERKISGTVRILSKNIIKSFVNHFARYSLMIVGFTAGKPLPVAFSWIFRLCRYWEYPRTRLSKSWQEVHRRMLIAAGGDKTR